MRTPIFLQEKRGGLFVLAQRCGRGRHCPRNAGRLCHKLSLATQEARVEYVAAIEDGNNALTYYTMAPNRGAQGGALFDVNGYLIGLNLWTDAYEGTTAYLLRRHGGARPAGRAL